MADISKITVGDTTYNLRDRNYCTCSTDASTTAKTASLSGFVLTTGSVVNIKFTNSNTASDPTLNVNNTGAYAIKRYGSTAASTSVNASWRAGSVVTLIFDGNYWMIGHGYDDNTTYYGVVDTITHTGKNMLPYPYEDTTKTIYGITFTDNGDGTITANGTVDSGYNAVFVLADSPLDEINPSGESVILSGCPEGGSSSTYCVYCLMQAVTARDYGSGANFGHPIYYAAIVIYSGTTVNNLTFSPMIRLATESADWEAYNGPEVLVTLPSYELSEGGIVAVKTDDEITRGSLLNINDTGAKQILNQVRPLKDSEICSGDTATFIYSNNIYHLLSVDRWQNLATPSSPGLMSASDKDKLNTVARNANNYYLPTASANVLGGVKVGTNLSISSGVLSATDTTYSDATTSDAGLMSATDKTKLDGIEAGANAYTLPTAAADTLGGVKVGTNLSISSGVLSATDTTYSAATTSVAGLMSAADKTKLDGIAAGANAYSLPTAAANTLGGVKVGTNLSISNGVLSATDTTYSAATTSAAGLMSAADKTKLNGIATGANAYSLPIATASALGGIKVGTNLSINASTGVLSATNTTYSNATQSAAGLMSAADKKKLDGVATGANAYSLPTASSSTLGGIKVGTNLSISNGVLSATNTTYSNATTSAAGLMSAADKTKLNAITPYPTAYSTSGNWKRLAFSNKLQILWCTQSVTIANINTQWGGGYEARIGYWSFPWAFNAVPTITVALQGCSGGACILEYTGTGSATSTQTYYAWRPTTGTNITITVGITAFGTYT